MHSALFWIDSSFLDRNCGMSCHTCTPYSKIGRIVVKYTVKIESPATTSLLRNPTE